MSNESLDLDCLRTLIEKLPTSFSATQKWTLMIPAASFRAAVDFSDDVLVEICRGVAGVAPPPTAITIIERPERVGEPGLSWCYWRAE